MEGGMNNVNDVLNRAAIPRCGQVLSYADLYVPVTAYYAICTILHGQSVGCNWVSNANEDTKHLSKDYGHFDL